MPHRKRDQVKRKLVLTDDLTVARFEYMRDHLAEALAGSDSVELELTEIKQADDALLQLICGAHRVADSLGKSFFLSTDGTREAVCRLAESMGYATHPCGKRNGTCLYRDTSKGKERIEER